MTPPDQNRTFDRSLITRLLKAVRWMLEKDEGFAATGARVWVLEKGDIVDQLKAVLTSKLSVSITFDNLVPADSSNNWVAKFSVGVTEQYILNRAKAANPFSAQQIAEMVLAILHQQPVEGSQDNWAKLQGTQIRFEGLDAPNNLLIWKVDFRSNTRIAVVNQEQV